ncbi:UDP-N-acetylmuramate:L-alanine ligase [Wigglesworthia glossinidia endosymbiont of Glossina morsitans morsitans (Yale colony)]|uniref:UDP-N-acetylmuramate--L-alanine ligase n=1 Tax=Wigglesworthia glossinidia endosymbiont of Glossina morsitans morsitans (Yale colony) TaxID=1142511 RepID=H6Q5A9_WIGGL|nr:UDP-N-acetylmuramate--L-alanine ligase [Wigglesworthia glossinidia]AFA41394.1 UDP-N-acetylmuramate:L-alanine ligase [Wigglesworthia glossinidia endosymbiont of Glossina morsitans morsitans (Yale colony)]
MIKNDLFFSKILKSDKIHFIGIGGAGMGALAALMKNLGYNISGSDIIENSIIHDLRKLGIKIFIKHSQNNIFFSKLVVVSSAIPENNEEIFAAKKFNIPIIKRAAMLFELMKFKYNIIISGTHGKTTTTAMLYHIFKAAQLNPTYINGGKLIKDNTRSYLGTSRYWIAEADESDASFLYFKPKVAVVTSIEAEHLNAYENQFKNLKSAFIKFLNNTSSGGYVILCLDDRVIQNIIPKINRKIVTYGFNKNSDIYIKKYYQKNFIFTAEIYIKKIKKHIYLHIKTPGKFNILNATAAISIAIEEGIHSEVILNAMLKFPGVYRRFNYIKNYNLKKINKKIGEIALIDDYGHHPTEIKLTIQIVKKLWCNRRLVMVFQPHRYTRMKFLYRDFIEILSTVDILLLLNIYPAFEKPIAGINSKVFCKNIRKLKKTHAVFVPNINNLYKILKILLLSQDILLLQGAGDIELIFKKLINKKI